MLGSFRFTRPNLKFTPRQAMNLLMMYPNIDVEKLNKKEITNFEILSQIMPSMTLKRKTGLFEDDEDYETSNNVVEVRNGEYVRGQLDKRALDQMELLIVYLMILETCKVILLIIYKILLRNI